jgi:hypothetical protein
MTEIRTFLFPLVLFRNQYCLIPLMFLPARTVQSQSSALPKHVSLLKPINVFEPESLPEAYSKLVCVPVDIKHSSSPLDAVFDDQDFGLGWSKPTFHAFQVSSFEKYHVRGFTGDWAAFTYDARYRCDSEVSPSATSLSVDLGLS